MSDIEFDILDELYFVQDFTYLQQALDLKEEILLKNLASLVGQGWVKCLAKNSDEVIPLEVLNIENKGSEYSYLATKAGLMAHNGR